MTDREFHLTAIHHRHQTLFEVIPGTNGRSLDKDRSIADSEDRKLRLKDVKLILGLAHFLSIHQEQRHDPVSRPLSNAALQINVLKLRIRNLQADRPFLQNNPAFTAPAVAFADLEWIFQFEQLPEPFLPS